MAGTAWTAQTPLSKRVQTTRPHPSGGQSPRVMHNRTAIHKKKKGAKKKNDYDDETLPPPGQGGEPENLPKSVASLRSRSPEWVFTIAGTRTAPSESSAAED